MLSFPESPCQVSGPTLFQPPHPPYPSGSGVLRLERSSTSATSSGCRRGLPLPVLVRKEPHLVRSSVFFDHFDCALPALKLRGVPFPKMQHPALQHPLATYQQTFAERIVNVRLAIFEYALVFENTSPSSGIWTLATAW